MNLSTAGLATIAPMENYFRTKTHDDSYGSHFLLQSANILASKDLRSIRHALQSSSLLESPWVHLRKHGKGPVWRKRESTPASHPGTGLGWSWDTSPGIQALSLPQHRPVKKQRMEEKGKPRKRIVKCRATGREEQQIDMEYGDTEPNSRENCSQPFSG